MKTNERITLQEKSAYVQINAFISKSNDWRGKKLSLLRNLIKKADPDATEEVKWKKPSKPEGVPVWSHNGILCVADILKNAVRLTFPNGAQIKDPHKLFNTRLDSNTIRAIDFFEKDDVKEGMLEELMHEAVKINSQKNENLN